MPHWIAQTPTEPASSVLLQYGAVGAIALLAIWAVSYLYKKQESSHESERNQWQDRWQSERDRADRMEAELLSLHGRISGEFAAKLVESTASMREWSETMKNRGDR